MDDTTTIVLLHGATSSPRIWQSVVPALTDRYTVLTPTLAGHLGGPPLPLTNGKVVERIVDDMCDQLDNVGLGQAHLVGNSLGGWVALELARRGRARSVLAFSPAGGWSRPADLQRMLLIFRIGAVLRRSKALPRFAAKPGSRRILLRAMAEHAERLTVSQTAALIEDMAGCYALADLIAGARTNGPIKPMSVHLPSAHHMGSPGQDAALCPLWPALRGRGRRRRGANDGRRGTRSDDRRPLGSGDRNSAVRRRRGGLEPAALATSRQMPPRATSWLAITLRWISLVPSPTIISGASRK
jgi:pimeloyl-ACP methyl ester carboxylesterase